MWLQVPWSLTTLQRIAWAQRHGLQGCLLLLQTESPLDLDSMSCPVHQPIHTVCVCVIIKMSSQFTGKNTKVMPVSHWLLPLCLKKSVTTKGKRKKKDFFFFFCSVCILFQHTKFTRADVTMNLYFDVYFQTSSSDVSLPLLSPQRTLLQKQRLRASFFILCICYPLGYCEL